MDPRSLWPPRRDDHRKGDFGRVVVAGGSSRYSGAPALNALAALRAGADLAVVVAPRRAADIVASHSPDLITWPCDAPWPDPALVGEALDGAQALVIGGGIERTGAAHEAIRRVVRACAKPMVLDAEALHAVQPDDLRGKTALLTPHGGEAKLLGGGSARDIARRFGAAVAIKGARDDISDGERVHVDAEGSPFLTKGGYGDLLAGAAGALLARGRSPFEAGVGAAWLVGRAGRLAADELGEATLASDALARFGDAWAKDDG